MTGGGGADTFTSKSTGTAAITDIGNGNDIISIVSTSGVVTATATANYTSGAASKNQAALTQGVITGSGFDINMSAVTSGTNGFTINGNGNAATLQGTGLGDSITGGLSNDSLAGHAGNDVLFGGLGNDTISAGAGDDTITVTTATLGQTALDSIDGGAGSDIFQISAAVTASDATTATFDMDLISNLLTIKTTGIGDDGENQTVVFSPIAETTAQTVVVNASTLNSAADTADFVVTNNAASATTVFSVTGGSGLDTINGSNGKDTILGAVGADSLIGGSGVDSIDGGAGVDLIEGGAGADSLTGGLGDDHFLYREGTEGKDNITDFATGTSQILFASDDVAADSDADVFDDGKINLAETDPTNTAGAIVVLHANDYDEQTGIASAVLDNHVNVFTTAAGWASATAALVASDAANEATDNASFFLVFYNSTSAHVELAHVKDAGTAAGGFANGTIETLTEFDDIAAGGIAAAFASTAFGVFSLG
jgi:Ca2+-binding RTX toxin-like protein